jgi:serine/threonine protein kinase
MAGISSSAPDKTGIVASEASTRSDAPVKADDADLNEHDAAPAAPAEAPKAEDRQQQQQQQQQEEEPQPKLTAAEVMAQLDAQREQQEKAFEAKYKVEKLLGNGAFGVVSLCTRLSDGAVFACKDISLLNKDTQKRREFIENEIACLGNAAGHFAIVKLHDVFPRENNTKWTLILDYADGGELAEQVALRRANGTSFSEPEILHIMVQLLLALEHLHTKRILHRDIKRATPC